MAVPVAPAAPTVSAITASGARVQWLPTSNNGGSAIINDRVQVSRTANFSDIVNDVTTLIRDQSFTGYSHSTVYYARVSTCNAEGWSEWSPVTTFTTLGTVPSALGAPSVDSITANSARITQGAIGDGGGSAVLEYRFQVGLNSSFGTLVYNGTSTDRVTVSTLSEGQSYWARFQARNAHGWSAWSPATQFYSASSGGIYPSGVAANSVTRDSAVISWANQSTVGNYFVRVEKVSDGTGVTRSSTTGPVTVTNLDPSTQYRARVAQAFGPFAFWSVWVTFTTVAGRPKILSGSGLEVPSRASGLCGARVDTAGWLGNLSVTVEVATDAAMTTDKVTLVGSKNVTSSSDSISVSDNVLQANGTYFARARITNLATSVQSDWSEVVSYNQSHTPSAGLLSPAPNSFAAYQANVPFSIRFIDSALPLDKVSAYRIAVERNDTGATVVDSGKQTYSVSSQDFMRTVAIGAALKGVKLRWRAKVWDQSNQESPWSGYNLFTLADVPVVVFSSPSNGSTVATGAPFFQWSATFPSGGTQRSVSLEVVNSLTSEVVWTGSLNGTGDQIVPPQTIVRNGQSYVAHLTVTDTFNLSTTVSTQFTVSYVEPGEISCTVDVSQVDTLGYVLVDWSSAVPDLNIISWVIYRREGSSGPWIEIAEIRDTGVRQYQDWSAVAGVAYQWGVVQRVNRSGEVLESSLEGAISTLPVAPSHSHYWLVVEDEPALSVLLPSVTSDSFSDEYESSSRTVIGRGRHVDKGTRLGYTGSLNVQLRGAGARAKRKEIEDLHRSQRRVHLRSPFGDSFPCSIGSPSVDRVPGTSTVEMTDLKIDYEEVF